MVDILYRSIIQRRSSFTDNLIVTDVAASASPAASIVEQPEIQTTSETVSAPAISPALVASGLVVIMNSCSPALVVKPDL